MLHVTYFIQSLWGMVSQGGDESNMKLQNRRQSSKQSDNLVLQEKE